MAQTVLTERQRDLLRWIVREVRAGNLPEAGIRFTLSLSGGCDVDNYAGDKEDIPTDSISQHVLLAFQQFGFIHMTGWSGGGKTTYECTLKQEAYDSVDLNFIEIDPRLKSIQLEPEQEALLAMIVEASRNVPRNQRGSFAVAQHRGVDVLCHAGLPGENEDIYMGDVKALARAKLIELSNPKGTPLFDVFPAGYQYYEYLKLRSGEPVRRVENEIRLHLTSESLRKKYPDAFQKWSMAESLLWGDDSEEQLTTVGHLCREAMQEFAEVLVNEFRPSGVDSNKANTVKRIRAVLNQHGAKLGTTVMPFLDALLTYWGTVSDLAQRQEHGAQKEGEPLKWEDARRVIFQTMLVMYEIDKALS